jgi:hypothetical protein
MNSQNWTLAFFEFFIVLAFGLAWWVMEWQGRKLDKKREAERRATENGTKVD